MDADEVREGVLAALRPRLGLPADADQADVLTAIERLRAPAGDPCTSCDGYGVVWHAGHYVPGEQVVEPPSEDRCEDCVGTGMAEVAVLAAEVRRLRGMQQRAREIYDAPAEHGLDAWRAARNILGESS